MASATLPRRRTRRRTRAESREVTRQHLFAAAERQFRRVGYHSATLEQVARDAGYTKGAVYSTFSSKLDLFIAAVAERAARRREELRLAKGDALEATLDASVRQMARSAVSERDYWASVIELMTAVGRDPAARLRYAEHRRETRAMIGEFFTRAAAERGCAPALTADEAGTVAMALSNGLILESMLDPDTIPEELFVRAHRVLFEGILALSTVESA